jgi:Domain of unknown function (DUF1844)
MSDSEYPLPPATFEFLVLSLRTQTEMQLGLLYTGEKNQPDPDFRIARHSIDLLAMLQDKTRGNISLEEQRLLENSLTELRFRYVQAMQQHPAKAAAPAPEPVKSGRTSDLMDAPPTEEKAPASEKAPEGQAGS